MAATALLSMTIDVAGGQRVTAFVSRFISATIQTAGSGYKVDDVLTISGGLTGEGPRRVAKVRVTEVGPGGAVLKVALFLENTGQYLNGNTPSNPASTTGGSGSGCKLTVTWATGAPSGASSVLLQAFGDYIRWMSDGTVPTSSVGHRLSPNDSVLLSGNLSNIILIGESGSSAVRATFFE